ncbi:cytochrome P450 [Nocardiopsis xinjiangensis]|uniref:cytochrome P450 n=1 Tax=Nocardiopsis xinjiangensis TaxID=124285 RepID=UPI001F4D34BA|nr:cytochrome P450 [Nocardiopsis xinjiangensis]
MSPDRPAGTSSAKCPMAAAREAAVPLYGQTEAPVPETMEDLRRRFGDLAPVEVAPGVLAWVLLSYELNRTVLQDARTFPRDPRRWTEAKEGRATPDKVPGPFWYFRNALSSDQPDHGRYREVIEDALSVLTAARTYGVVDEFVRDLMAEPASRGRADLVSDLAFRLPLLLLNDAFGLDSDQGAQLVGLMRKVWDGGEEAEAAMGGLFGYAQSVTLQRREDPGSDVVSRMITHPNGLDDEEVAHQLILIISAAHDPLMNLIANTFHALLSDRGSRADIMSGNARIEELVDIVLWKAPPIYLMPGRYPAQQMDLDGWTVGEGDCLIMGYGPAHSDPHVVEHLDLTAPSGTRAHLAFGTGPHQCPARNLARQIGVDAVGTVFRMLPDMALSVPPSDLTWRRSPFAHGLEALPVTFDPVRTSPRTPQKTPSSGGQSCPHTPDPSSSNQETSEGSHARSGTPGPLRALWSRVSKSGR